MEHKGFAPKPKTTAPEAVKAPSPSLPKGGGAVRGLGEKFAASLVSGTGSLTVPIAVSPGRGGFGPELAVAYDSGGGNGPFGVGFRLSVPSISRKTERGLPEYEDFRESDVFILSGAEDLVPKLDEEGEGNWVRDVPKDDAVERIERYRPRVEGLFARIERVTEKGDGNVYWRATTKDNVTSIYGQSAGARIASPAASTKVYSWLLERTEDALGNVIVYDYKAEDFANVPKVVYERQRLSGDAPVVNRYLKRIRYGNAVPFQAQDFLFEVVFDYGEHGAAASTPAEENTWPCRQDPFSSYRSTFEIRTYRLCRRALMFHHFPELGEDPVLVRSTDFTYAEGPALTRLISATQSGYIKTESGYSKKSLPPLELGYSLPELQTAVKLLDPRSLEDLPGGVDGQTARWVDLDGEGIPGVLCEQQGAFYYKQNLGDGHLAPARLLASRPTMASGGGAQLLDVGSEGRQCLVELTPEGTSGYHERTLEGGWGPFVPFPSQPNVNWNDPRVRFIDLSGDGLDDILVTTDHVQLWYPSLGKGGWGPPRVLPKIYDEDKSPTLVFADMTQAIFVADMSGDGLPDIVRVRNGSICYWPNLGRGRFGAKVQMSKAPLFDDSHTFDPRRIRLGDIDGTGTTDIVYVAGEGAVLVFNQAGNGWSEPVRMPGFPTADSMSTVGVVDVLGSGTACLVWSSPWRGVAKPPMRYIDLLGSKKPYLLTSVKNNLGAETKLEYAPSTKFYLEDLKAGKPWVTRLSFPVHVLTRVETFDAVSKARFVSTYKYHHGYYDGAEREFRGFGLVEQFDAESFSAERGKGLFAEAPPTEEEFHLPPVLTKMWFHTGAFIDRNRITKQFEKEYYAGDEQRPEFPDAVLKTGLSPRDSREACRALKGQILRTEVYALDGSEAESHPYVVTEVCPAIVRVQPSTAKAYGSFFAYARESVEVHYERNHDDPRVVHTLALEVDPFGHVARSASIAYARRCIPLDIPEQGLLATLTETDVVNEDQQASWYRLGVPKEKRTYELTGLSTERSTLFSFGDVFSAVNAAVAIPYEATPNGTTMQKRLVEQVRQVYYNSTTLSGSSPAALPFGTIDALALSYETYALAFTPGLLTAAYGTRVISTMLTEGGYIEENDDYWVRTGRQVFDPDKFYLPVEILDPLSNSTTITYDTYNLLVTSAEDALGNTVTATNDYRVLGPTLVTDPNGNRSAVKLDELGMVVATAVMGKVGSNDGDTLEEPTTTFEHDLDVWRTTGKPNVVHAAARERHGDALTPWQHSYTYLDGLGREILKKVQAEPGPAPVRDENGGLVKDENGAVVLATASPRWVGTGRVVIDNKGNPVKQYEPFFTATHEYEDEQELVEWGVTPVLRYDPLGRLIRTDLPNGTHSRVTFTPWQQASWDGNDTVLETGNPWYAARQPSATPTPSAQEQRAAELTEEHAETPALVHFDVLGRSVRGVEDNKTAGVYTTKAVLDIEGNPRAIIDARGNTAMEYVFDMLGRTLYQKSCDSGERWTLANVLGNPIRGWDGRGHVVRSVYDALNRRTGLWVQKGADPEVLAEVTVYGEGQTDPEDANLRGKVVQVKDGAGVVTSVEYDFKGNLLESQRQLAQNYSTQLDWSGSVALEAEVFTQTTVYDAQNRPTSMTTPDQSEIKPTYNEASLLEKVEARIRGASSWTTFVDDIDYDAKGQREKIAYGNGVVTEYSYDPLTYRLTRLKTTRTSDNSLLQDLRYTYDPVGNIVEIADLAQEALYHNSELVEPVWKYEYDAIYRLIEATGREHSGQNSDIQQDADGFPLVSAANPNDPQAMRNYAESFEYDAVGNILKMIHVAQGSTGSWARRYDIAQTSNRLLGTSLPGDDETEFSATYTYDEHGSMTSMPHLDGIEWDFKDQKREVDKGGGGTVYFTYDAGGQRVRKVWEHSGIVEERIYLGGFEVYRRHELGAVVLERETFHVMDDARRTAMVETKTVDASDPNLVVTSRVRYQLGNHLGSAALELDEDGLVISYEEYHPYGTSAYHAVASGVEVSAKRYRYTGKERDEETGLYYHGARYYAPWLARWTSADPAGLIDGPGLYTYVRGNPVQLIDPNGTDAQKPTHRFTQEELNRLPPARIPKGARVGYLNQPGHKAGTYVKGGKGAGQPPKPPLPPSPPSPPPAPPGSGQPGDANVPKGPGEHHGPGGKGTGNAEGKGTSAESGASYRTSIEKLAEKLALLAGIVESEFDHDFAQEGASSHGIVGGKSTNGPDSSVLQMVASGIQMGATVVVQGLVKAFNTARSLASRLRMLPGPKPTKLLPTPKWKASGFASQEHLDHHFNKHARRKNEWGTGNITKEGYAKRARNLLNTEPVPGGDVLGFTSEGGFRFRYNVRTNEFATAKADGTIETLFRPTTGMAYWMEQVEKHGP
ncbi:SpvB/TcaC N-terminal domain-containing protein [Polyangium sorediatum]|uniref:SpvB/TcaC N-terminal domain-containing protein n=1 Tax=Polyangium sorediatum TaxID=889274 RepID=A0ABT6P479_9BACT|nr:SpvB/TcaC N-terminal domain-containing protein [Polyangium sorediatum]MDI1435403.1 SpvB/TcaC N-terminal domain-containing protein [Polyangium sorediatum]